MNKAFKTSTGIATTAAASFDDKGGKWVDNTPASGTMVAYALFKLEGVTYDEVTGLFSMAVEQKILDEQDWQVIAGSFGLNTVPEHLRDDLCKMVRQHAIAETLAERIVDVQ